jgi:hypothetical protein
MNRASDVAALQPSSRAIWRIGLPAPLDRLSRPDGPALGQDRDGQRRERDGTKVAEGGLWHRRIEANPLRLGKSSH